VRFNKRLWFLLAAAAPTIVFAAKGATQRLEPGDRSTPNKELARVIGVEQDFAAASLRQGIKQSFLAYAAPDAVLFRPEPVAAVPALMNDPDDNGGLTLDWWPAMGAIAGSGDLALSVGPWVLEAKGANRRLYGYYATIWKRQQDGGWKFVIDGAGARISSEPVRQKGGAIEKLPVSDDRRSAGPGAALDEVRALEGRIGQAALSDARQAIGSSLASDAWVIGSSAEPEGTRNGWRSEIMKRPTKLRLQYLKGDASAGGDFAYTYGLVESLDPSIPLRHATYLHVWQRRKGEWRLIFQGIKQGGSQ